MPIQSGTNEDAGAPTEPPAGLSGTSGSTLWLPTFTVPNFAFPPGFGPELGIDADGSAPTGLTATAKPGHIRLTWTVDQSDSTITHYLIYRSVDGGSYFLFEVAENIFRYATWTEAQAASPAITPVNFFHDYRVVSSSTYTYRISAVRTVIESVLTSATSGVSPTSLPAEAVIPPLPVSPSVLPPQSRLWLFWTVGGSIGTVAGTLNHLGIDLAGRFGNVGWSYFKTQEIDPVVEAYPLVNHVIYQPWGKTFYYTNASTPTTGAQSFPLGTEIPVSEGGAGNFSPYYNACTDSCNYYDLCAKRVSQPSLAIMLHGLEDFLRSFGERGSHVSVFMSILLANGNKDDGTILSAAGMRHALAGNAGVMFDTAAVVDTKFTPHGARHPAFRACEIALSMGYPVWVEPIDHRADQRHWLSGQMDVGMISTGSRTVHARQDASNVYTKETEVLGFGHIAIVGIGSTYWTPAATTNTEVFDIALRELQAGNHVAITDGSVFSALTQSQRDALLEASRITAPPASLLGRRRAIPRYTKYDLRTAPGTRIRDFTETRV